MQRNWIGRSEGTEVEFVLEEKINQGIGNRASGERPRIRVFTTRVDTIFGATSIQLAPEHPLVAKLSAARCGLGPAGSGPDRGAEKGTRVRRHRRH